MRLADERLFQWWLEMADGRTLEESRPAFDRWLEDVREVLHDFWGT